MNNPVRLERRQQMTFSEKLLAFLNNHAFEILFICVILLFILVFALFIVLLNTADASNATNIPSMMDSGNYYYHLQDVI